MLGQPLARLDVPEKVNGKAEFGIDVKRPGLLVARVVRCPVFGGKVASFNADKAKAVPGVRHVVQISTGIAVVADGYWAASTRSAGARGHLERGAARHLSSAAIAKQYAALAQKPGAVARNEGDADAHPQYAGSFWTRRFEQRASSSASSKRRSWRTPAWSR